MALSQAQIQALVCDAPGCAEQLLAPVPLLAEHAHAAGWQARIATALITSDDGPEVTFEDRCPQHPAQPLTDHFLISQAGGPGGLSAGVLSQERWKR